jgi:BASS family bile acid:Na+ symporter
MELKQLVLLAIQVSIIATVFGFGLRASTDDVLYLVRRPGLLGRSLLAVLVIMPIVAVALISTFHFPPTVNVVLSALSVSPVPPLFPKKGDKAGGPGSYGVGLMATLAVLSIGLVPLGVALMGRLMPMVGELLGRVFRQPFGMGPGPIAAVMLKMVLLPLGVGVAIRTLVPATANRLAGPVSTAANVMLPLAILPLAVVVLPTVWGLIGDGTVVAFVLFVIVGLAVGHVLGGPDPHHAGVLALASASRHPAIALTIAAANFPEERFGGTIVLYLIVNTIVAIPYIAWQRKHVAAAAPAP